MPTQPPSAFPMPGPATRIAENHAHAKAAVERARAVRTVLCFEGEEYDMSAPLELLSIPAGQIRELARLARAAVETGSVGALTGFAVTLEQWAARKTGGQP